MKLLECKIHFLDSTIKECNSFEQMLNIIFKEKKKPTPTSIEISGVDETGSIYKTRLNFVEFSSQRNVFNTKFISKFAQQKLLGEILVEENIITKEQLEEVIEIQNKYKEKLGEILIKFGYCKPEQILYALAKQLGINLKKEEIKIEK
ncbi:MAG: hypothetical protein RMJ67_02495 [Elusimicrobiota bacterium]|nr:hypothetical protein [Endomicrobiia bacterium]MDW8165366.1 hypothetical protein [Elusimicrobiota bacterium]